MRKLTLLAATAALALGAGAGQAQDKKQLVIVVKGLDNPFFEAINQGCQKWNSENPDSEYECFYTGPASTSDEAGEAQIIQDMLSKPSTAAIAISPSNAPLHAQTVKSANPTIPVMTIDADFTEEDAGVRQTYLGTDNYLMGYRIGEYIKEKKPDGGKICTIQGNPAADNILRRAQGMRDAVSGTEGLAALDGSEAAGGWTEVAGCPVFTNDDGAKGVQSMTDILAANPDLDAFGIMGGWPLFGGGGDRQGGSGHRAGRPAAVRDGLPGARRHDQADQRRGGRGPGLHRPRRVHQGHRRHLHPEVGKGRSRATEQTSRLHRLVCSRFRCFRDVLDHRAIPPIEDRCRSRKLLRFRQAMARNRRFERRSPAFAGSAPRPTTCAIAPSLPNGSRAARGGPRRPP
jgi:ribose transport system substrate-binding protein